MNTSTFPASVGWEGPEAFAQVVLSRIAMKHPAIRNLSRNNFFILFSCFVRFFLSLSLSLLLQPSVANVLRNLLLASYRGQIDTTGYQGPVGLAYWLQSYATYSRKNKRIPSVYRKSHHLPSHHQSGHSCPLPQFPIVFQQLLNFSHLLPAEQRASNPFPQGRGFVQPQSGKIIIPLL